MPGKRVPSERTPRGTAAKRPFDINLAIRHIQRDRLGRTRRASGPARAGAAELAAAPLLSGPTQARATAPDTAGRAQGGNEIWTLEYRLVSVVVTTLAASPLWGE
jgi:hypothetical protein